MEIKAFKFVFFIMAVALAVGFFGSDAFAGDSAIIGDYSDNRLTVLLDNGGEVEIDWASADALNIGTRLEDMTIGEICIVARGFLKEGNYAAAIRLLWSALRLYPDEPDLLGSLGYEFIEGFWRKGAALERARGNVWFEGQWLKEETKAEKIRKRHLEARAFIDREKLPEGSICLRSAHFYLAGNIPGAEAREYLKMLEAMRVKFRELFLDKGPIRMLDPDDMVVIILSDPELYGRYGESVGIKIPGNTFGWFSSGLVRAIAFKRESAPDTGEMMKHEVSHMLFFQSALRATEWIRGGKISPWFYEGLAEYFEAGIYENDKFETGGIHERNLEIIRNASNDANLIGLRDLIGFESFFVKGEKSAPSGDRVGLAYAQSWLLVQYFLEGGNQDYRNLFNTYFYVSSMGYSGLECFEKLFGPVEKIENELKEYMGVLLKSRQKQAATYDTEAK